MHLYHTNNQAQPLHVHPALHVCVGKIGHVLQDLHALILTGMRNEEP